MQGSVNAASSQHHVDHLSNNLNRFFQQAEIWAKAYANTLVPAALQSVTKKLKERHMNVAISSKLLHDPETCRHTITILVHIPPFTLLILVALMLDIGPRNTTYAVFIAAGSVTWKCLR